MLAAWSHHFSAAFFQADPQVASVSPGGILPKEEMGASPPLEIRICPPRRIPNAGSSPRIAVEIRHRHPEAARAHESVQRPVEENRRGVRPPGGSGSCPACPFLSWGRTARRCATASAAGCCSASTRPESRRAPAAPLRRPPRPRTSRLPPCRRDAPRGAPNSPSAARSSCASPAAAAACSWAVPWPRSCTRTAGSTRNRRSPSA